MKEKADCFTSTCVLEIDSFEKPELYVSGKGLMQPKPSRFVHEEVLSATLPQLVTFPKMHLHA